MRTLLSRAIQVDPSFNVGLAFVVLLALAEIFAAASYYVSRLRAAGAAAPAIALNMPARPAAQPTAAPPAAQPAVSPAAAISAPSPSLVNQLLREGIEFRDRDDTTNAIARFQEALDSEPDNPAVLSETAKTYDRMQMYDRANEMWRKIQELGPATGAAYELAEQRLKLGVPAPATSESTAPSSSAGSVSNRDVGGKAEGTVMGISDVKIAETPDPDAETSLAFQISIKKQAGATIDHTKVKIKVEFYDTVGDKDVKLTDADVNYDWLTSKHDWSDPNPEVLAVKYIRPKTAVASSEASLSEAAATIRPGHKSRGKGSGAESTQRKYLGYIVRVYYDDELQAVQAEPSRLLQLFPPSKNTSVQ
jgi:tetratricopeptide (TPR) repeat protein